MLALCFECGQKKTGALKLCSQCHSVPKSEEEQILSLCLSLECVTEQTLRKCRQHFKKKNKPPRFKEPIMDRARRVLEEMAEQDSDQSVMFSASVFDFSDLDDDSGVVKRTVTAHIIGKGPKQEVTDVNASLGKAHKTYHRAQWTVGKEISEEMYESNKDRDGDVYVWYRWLNNEWKWMCVSSGKFDQLKSVESGRLGR